MRRTTWIAIVASLTVGLAAPAASAHESYDVGGGEYTLTVGDQNEPIYTYKWTNLDLIIRDSEGEPVALDEGELEELNATLVAPGGETLDRPLEPQFGEEGRYAFDEGHFYTQPGQYTLELDGEIEGVNATGEYDLPGPRQSSRDFGFPGDEVPTVLDLQDRIETLEMGEEERELQQQIEDLQSQVTSLEQEVETLREDQRKMEAEQERAPGFGLAAAVAAIAAVALLGVRRDR